MALIAFYTGINGMAQLRTVENRPYTDLRPFHFGVLIGTHAQDMEFQNTGITQYIDANGIVNVSAKDLGTGKEQKITIKSSSGLDKSEIDRMVKEAAAHEAEDKKRKEGIEAKNNADSLIYQAEKTIKDMGDKADAAKVSEIKDKIADLKEAVKSDDVDKIKAASEALTKPLYDLTSEMYKNADAASQQAQPEGGSAQSDAGDSQKQDDNVVDADYTVVDDDKK